MYDSYHLSSVRSTRCSKPPTVTKRKYWSSRNTLDCSARAQTKILYQAQLRRQLQHIARHFALQQQKYAKEHTADSLWKRVSLCSSAELSHALSTACSQTLPLKTKHLSYEM